MRSLVRQLSRFFLSSLATLHLIGSLVSCLLFFPSNTSVLLCTLNVLFYFILKRSNYVVQIVLLTFGRHVNASCHLVQAGLVDILSKSKWWQASQGRDHILVAHHPNALRYSNTYDYESTSCNLVSILSFNFKF